MDTSFPTSLPESALQNLRDRLDSAACELELVRPGDVAKYTAALNTLTTFHIEILLKFTNSESSSNPKVPDILASMSESERLSFVRSKSPAPLQRGICLAFVGILYLKQGSYDKGGVVNTFGKLLRHQWHLDRTDSNLDDAIYYFRKAVEVEPPDSKGLDLSLEDLACTVLEKFKKTRSLVDFEEIRDAFERAISLGRDGTPFYTSSLGIVWKERAVMAEEGRDALLDTSIETHIKALKLLSLNPSIMTSSQIQYLHRNLAESYFERYELSSADPAGTLHDSVKTALANSTFRWMLLYELAILQKKRFNKQGHRPDADKCIALFHSALEDQPNNTMILHAMSAILHENGILDSSPQMTSRRISILEAIVAATPETDLQFPIHLKSLSYALFTRFKRSGSPGDLDNAITAVQRASTHPSLDKLSRWEYLRLLSDELLKRFETRNLQPDLEAASTLIQLALDSTELAPQSKAFCLHSFGCILKIRSAYEGPSFLEQAIKSFQDSLSLLSTDLLRAQCYNDLGNTYMTKFERTGSRGDIHQSIDFYLQAIALVEQDASSAATEAKLMFLVGLGSAHAREHEKWNRVASIDLAISCYQEAVNGTDEEDENFIGRTGNLCHALGLKFAVNEDKKLLKRAQDSLVAILDRPKPLSPEQTSFIRHTLGAIFYQSAFKTSGLDALPYLNQAAECFQKSLESGSGNHDSIRNTSAGLLNILVSKYELTQSESDLIQVLTLMPQMIKNKSLQNSFEALHGCGRFFSNLMANQKFTATIQATCGSIAIQIFSMISNETNIPSPPNLQAGSARRAAILSFELNKNARDASRFLTNATELLSQAIIVGPNRLDHLRAIKELHTIPTLTLSMFLEAGEPVLKALQMCERGRCLILDRLIDQKSDISNLEVSHPELAVKFEDLRERLARNNNTSRQVLAGLRASSLQNINDSVFEYKQTLAAIRQKPGFEDFLLLPEDVTNILDYAVSGNIVLLNTSKYRCDAILITSGGVSHLPLPGIFKPTGQHLDDLAGITGDTKDFNNLMKWLWVVIACPVLDELGHTGVKDDGSLPRVWWMTSGWISPLPIHAAGDYAKAKETGEPCTVLDRVISSYVPTLKMLKFVRDKRKNFLNLQNSDLPKNNEALIVQMPVTPNNTDLPHVSRECEMVEKHLQKDLHITSRSCPKRSGILASLESASIAHFACHGISNAEDPSLSRLLLQDWRSAPFDVRFIVGMSIQCQLVYLSACQTGSAANAQYLSTESIHISSAFLAAGVPYVIATLVDIDDEISVTIADKFYSYLVEKNMDISRSAEALHAAQVYARDSGIEPFQWLAFAHFGA